MSAAPFDLAKANRWFAIELNNRAWDLLEKRDRSEAETAEMIHAAHASTYHWGQAGTGIHAVRARNLLATVYVAAGCGQSAWGYAQEGLRALDGLQEDSTPFDRGAILGSLAQSARLIGKESESQRYFLDADSIWQGLEPDERALLERLYPRA